MELVCRSIKLRYLYNELNKNKTKTRLNLSVKYSRSVIIEENSIIRSEKADDRQNRTVYVHGEKKR